MNKTDTAHAAQNETLHFNPLFGSEELKLQTTPKAETPFAGMASFFAWLGALEFPKRVAAVMPFEYRSPNAIAPEQTLMAFISAVVVGAASRFAHAGWLRHGTAFHALLGVRRFPAEDAIRRFFHRFTQAHIEAFWCPLWRWMLKLLEASKEGFSLDLDSTVFSREGGQEGRHRVIIRGDQAAEAIIRFWRCWRRCVLFCTRGCGRETRGRHSSGWC